MPPYSSQASVLWLESFPTVPTVTAMIMHAHLYRGGGGPRPHSRVVFIEVERVSLPASSGSTVALSFTKDMAPYTGPDETVSLMLLDPQSGIIFRSPHMASLPPGAPGDPNGVVDVLVPVVQVTTLATMNAALATRVNRGDFNAPTQDPSLMITSATLALASGRLDLTVMGTRSSGGFTYGVGFTVEPVGHPYWGLPTVTRAVVPPVLGFTAGPGGGFETFLLNLFSGLLTPELTKTILTQINAGLVDSTRSAAATAAGIAPPAPGVAPVLPQAVYLSVRRIVITPTGVGGQGPGVYAWGAIGSFGSLMNHLFPGRSQPSTPTCAPMMLLAPVVLQHQLLGLFRDFRDTVLLSTAHGRHLVHCYYRHHEEVASILRARPPLADAAARVAIAAGRDLRASRDLSTGTRRQMATLLGALVPHASPGLATGILSVTM